MESVINKAVNEVKILVDREQNRIIDHFQINTEDIPERVAVKYQPDSQRYFVDGNLVLSIKTIHDFAGGRVSIKFLRNY